MIQLLTGLAANQVLQRDRHGLATIVASGSTTAKGPVFATVAGLRGFAKPRLVGLARGGRFAVRLPGLPVGGLICYEVRFANVTGNLRGKVEQAFTLVDTEHRVMDAIIRTEWLTAARLHIFAWPNLVKSAARLKYGHGCNPPAQLTDERDYALPVTGPLKIEGEILPGPGLIAWTGGITVYPETLDKLDAESVARLAAKDANKTVGEGYWPEFINLHERWVGHRGVACFTIEVEVSALSKLTLGFGYDGPVRLWLDEREIHYNPNGTNPCIADQHLIPVKLTSGRHRLSLAVDVNGGQAWGFALRWLSISPTTIFPATIA